MNDKNLAIALFALLERENTVSVPQMASLLGSDEETILALLEELVFAYDSVDLRLDLGGAHASLMRSGTNRILRLNAQETNALLDALEAYGFAKDSELAKKLIYSKSLLDEETAVQDAQGRIRTVNKSVNAHIAEKVAVACEDDAHHVLQIEYQKEGAREPEVRVVEPYGISTDGDRSMLEAYDQGRAGWRSFRLDRIKSIRALKETFVKKPYSSSRNQSMATVRFADGVLPDTWPGLKRVRTLDDGAVEAKIPWYGSMWLPKRIVSMLGKAQPLAPAALCEACATYACQLLDE